MLLFHCRWVLWGRQVPQGPHQTSIFSLIPLRDRLTKLRRARPSFLLPSPPPAFIHTHRREKGCHSTSQTAHLSSGRRGALSHRNRVRFLPGAEAGGQLSACPLSLWSADVLSSSLPVFFKTKPYFIHHLILRSKWSHKSWSQATNMMSWTQELGKKAQSAPLCSISIQIQ